MTLARFKAPLATAAADDSVATAARTMRERRVGCVVVTRKGKATGIVTDRDLVVRVLAEGLDAWTTKVGDIVTYDPVTVSVHEGIETAVARMRRHGVRRLPIVEDDGVAVGIVTADDLLVLLGGEIAAVCEGIENRADAEDSR
ncbi:MAG TPA: CBS domain-containing protein [Polyangiaceae bacterium]|jgi:CBS domain-containing protein